MLYILLHVLMITDFGSSALYRKTPTLPTYAFNTVIGALFGAPMPNAYPKSQPASMLNVHSKSWPVLGYNVK